MKKFVVQIGFQFFLRICLWQIFVVQIVTETFKPTKPPQGVLSYDQIRVADVHIAELLQNVPILN
jgi:hypothetical protein